MAPAGQRVGGWRGRTSASVPPGFLRLFSNCYLQIVKKKQLNGCLLVGDSGNMPLQSSQLFTSEGNLKTLPYGRVCKAGGAWALPISPLGNQPSLDSTQWKKLQKQ